MHIIYVYCTCVFEGKDLKFIHLIDMVIELTPNGIYFHRSNTEPRLKLH